MSINPWANSNSYFKGAPPQPVPPPASFTIGGSDPGTAPQPVPPPSARPAVFGKQMTSPGIQENRGLPNRLYECQGTIVIYQPMLECGIVSLVGGDDQSVYCFFLSRQACGPVQLRTGVRILTNARLVRPQAKVPYLASTVWGVGMQAREELMQDLHAPALPQELEKYYNLSDDLSFELDDLRNKGERITVDGLEGRGGQERKRAASPDRLSGLSSRSRYSEEEKGKRSRLDRTTPPMDKEYPVGSSPSSNSMMMNIPEEFSEWGVTGVVDKYLTSMTGVISVKNANRKVLFHVNQVWMPSPDGGDSPFLATHPLIKLPTVIEVGQELKLNARRISGCSFNLQATAVWKRKDPPANYKTEDLLQNLNLTLNQHIFSETGDTLYKTNPLAGTPDFVVSAKVQEYFSLEMGFLKLDSGDRGVVLFHLNQVWTEGGLNAVPYRNDQDIILPEYLPIGSSVMVNMRKLQASQGSALKYQATLVWPRKIDEEITGKLLPAYLSMYGPHEKRVSLVNELNDHHDQMKSILKLCMSSLAPEFVPVEAVLNGLPNFWKAQVVAALNDDFGIIRITHSQGLDFAPGVYTMFALFHIEDVFDANGLPAIKSANVTMANMMDSHVDLTARSISLESDPHKIFDLQRRLNEESVDSGCIPILQAIVVCVQMQTSSDILLQNDTVFPGIPKPTPLTGQNQCFGSGKFYLNPVLSCKLDQKLKHFLNLENKPNLPYRNYIKTKPYSSSESQLLKDLKKVDINRTERFLYGEFPRNIRSLPPHISSSLPKVLDFHPVKLKYLHCSKLKSDCGVVEISINPADSSRDKITTYAFFRLSRYKFFTPKDCFASDLANIMPIYSKERFSVNAVLAFPDSKIPYVAQAIWNENLRQDLNESVPQMSEHPMNQDKGYINSCSKVIAEITNETPAAVASKGLPAIPSHIGTTNKDIKVFNKAKVIMDGDKLVETLENMTGIVETVLSPHLAIVTITKKHSSFKFRVLCSSDDVFDLKFKERIHPRDFHRKNPVRFSSASEVWDLTARRRKVSLQGLLRQGQKVKLNAVPLFSHPNPANVHYVSSGVLVGKNSLDHPVPVHCIKSSALFNKPWKQYFQSVVRSLNKHGQLNNKKNETPPAKMQESLMQGRTDKLELRAEYRAEGVGQLPTPVRTNQKVAKPVWKDILNEQYGQVIRIMDKNYGIAAGFVANGRRNGRPEFLPFQMVFDTFDVYIGYYDCNELGKSLADVMKVGDFIKFNGVRVDPAKSGDARDIRYLATALVVAKTSDEVKTMEFPSDIAKIETIDQVAKTKIDNFKIVAGVMNTTQLSKTEEEIIDDIKRGRLGSKFLDLSNHSGCTDDVLQESGGSDDEATCVEKYVKVGEKEKEQNISKEVNIVDIQTLVSELKPKELRKLIMSYIEFVTKLPEEASKKKFDIGNIVKTLNSDKSIRFFADFFISLGHACKTAEKGIKVGHVFLTQTQVKAIRLKGIACEDDIDIEKSEQIGADNKGVDNVGDCEGKVEQTMNVDQMKTCLGKKEEKKVEEVEIIEEEIVVKNQCNNDGKIVGEIQEVKALSELKVPDSKVPESSSHEEALGKLETPQLRKFLLSFMKLIDNSITLDEVAKNCNVTEEDARKLLAAITFKCRESPVVEGKRQSFKLKNIFVNSTWVEKIVVFNFQ